MAVRRRIGEALKGFADAFGPLYQQQQYYDRLARGDERAERAEKRSIEAASAQQLSNALGEAQRRVTALGGQGATPEEWEAASTEIPNLFPGLTPEQTDVVRRRVLGAEPSMARRGLMAAETFTPEALPGLSQESIERALEQQGAPVTDPGFARDYPGRTPVQGSLGYLGPWDPGGPDPGAREAFEAQQRDVSDLQEALEDKARKQAFIQSEISRGPQYFNVTLPDNSLLSLRESWNPVTGTRTVESLGPFQPGFPGSDPRDTGTIDPTVAAWILGQEGGSDTLVGMQGALQPPEAYAGPPVSLDIGPATTMSDIGEQLRAMYAPAPEGIEGGEAALSAETGFIPYDPTAEAEVDRPLFMEDVEVVVLPSGERRYLVKGAPPQWAPQQHGQEAVRVPLEAQDLSEEEFFNWARARLSEEVVEQKTTVADEEERLAAAEETYNAGGDLAEFRDILEDSSPIILEAKARLAQLNRHMEGMMRDPMWDTFLSAEEPGIAGVDVGGPAPGGVSEFLPPPPTLGPLPISPAGGQVPYTPRVGPQPTITRIPGTTLLDPYTRGTVPGSPRPPLADLYARGTVPSPEPLADLYARGTVPSPEPRPPGTMPPMGPPRPLGPIPTPGVGPVTAPPSSLLGPIPQLGPRAAPPPTGPVRSPSAGALLPPPPQMRGGPSMAMVPPITPRPPVTLPPLDPYMRATMPITPRPPITAPLPRGRLPGSATVPSPITAPLPMGTMPITPRPPITAPPIGRVQGGGLPPVPPITATMPVPGAQQVDLSGWPAPDPSVTVTEDFPGAGPRAPQPPPTLDPSWLPDPGVAQATTPIEEMFTVANGALTDTGTGAPLSPQQQEAFFARVREAQPVVRKAILSLDPQRYAHVISASHLEDLVLSQIFSESSFLSSALSPENARGHLQLTPIAVTDLNQAHLRRYVTPKTGPNLTPEGTQWVPHEMTNQADLEQNIPAGIEYLVRLIGEYGNISTALAAFNAGAGMVDKSIDTGTISPEGVPPSVDKFPKDGAEDVQAYVDNILKRVPALAQSRRGPRRGAAAGGGQ